MTMEIAVRVGATANDPAFASQAWSELGAHYKKTKELHLRQLFAGDPERGERLSAEAVGLYLDYSKNRITDETLRLLIRLAYASGLQERIDAMFRGDKINLTEKRAVLHTALRAPRDFSILVDGEDVVPKVHAVLDRMADFANRVRTGGWIRSHRETDSERDQHWHRWLRPGPGNGVRGTEALLRQGNDVSLRLQHRQY